MRKISGIHLPNEKVSEIFSKVADKLSLAQEDKNKLVNNVNKNMNTVTQESKTIDQVQSVENTHDGISPELQSYRTEVSEQVKKITERSGLSFEEIVKNSQLSEVDRRIALAENYDLTPEQIDMIVDVHENMSGVLFDHSGAEAIAKMRRMMEEGGIDGRMVQDIMDAGYAGKIGIQEAFDMTKEPKWFVEKFQDYRNNLGNLITEVQLQTDTKKMNDMIKILKRNGGQFVRPSESIRVLKNQIGYLEELRDIDRVSARFGKMGTNKLTQMIAEKEDKSKYLKYLNELEGDVKSNTRIRQTDRLMAIGINIQDYRNDSLYGISASYKNNEPNVVTPQILERIDQIKKYLKKEFSVS